ncbi:CHAT domain-containing protein [Micromonospora sp. NPDC126480]|uniref:CHAT domain-containing protein n=1 Tax=Micromonospora sp. NPDC126480 TaxID=3155312 RepID=UPI00332FA24A
MTDTLRVHHALADDGTATVRITWPTAVGSPPGPSTTTSSFSFEYQPAEREKLRWYLEDSLAYPTDPVPDLARAAERTLWAVGARLFTTLLGGAEARARWRDLRERLAELSIEISADSPEGAGLPWELLRDPANDEVIALEAASFVRLPAGSAASAPAPSSSGPLRVLLVICRPDGAADVPFRSVARQLLRTGPVPPSGSGSADDLRLDVLRPATVERLAETVLAAARAGRPYHVVHFDGHGTYGAPTGSRRRGYLLFEQSGSGENRRPVDGRTVGDLLVRGQVPLLVLNACRSAYAEAPPAPAAGTEPGDGPGHDRLRAFGSFAHEVAESGVPAVVAMGHNVYVGTAVRFTRALYRDLRDGVPLGQAVRSGRRLLAALPERPTPLGPRQLQDWVVPVVYQRSPVRLLGTAAGDGAARTGTGGRTAAGAAPAAAGAGDDPQLPVPPTGFHGRDETLLALDRAFDERQVVLLTAFAGSGKTSTAAEFARWYRSTGGMPGGRVLVTSFVHKRGLPELLDQVADAFPVEVSQLGAARATLPGPARRDVVLALLRAHPVLWIWDNVETAGEVPELAQLLRDLATESRAKVLLTSRRAERAWLGALPYRLSMPPLAMAESLGLTRAVVELRDDRFDRYEDWRPLLRYCAGNPLTILVTVGQALREAATSRSALTALVDRLRSGTGQAGDGPSEEPYGQSTELHASLSYGFANAFDDRERGILALLHLFRDQVAVSGLLAMGSAELAAYATNAASLPELRELSRPAATDLLDRAADGGLLTRAGQDRYTIHPALPWYLTRFFDEAYGADPQKARRAYASSVAMHSYYLFRMHQNGVRGAVPTLRADESNLLAARELAMTHGWWDLVMWCMRGLNVLLTHDGRRAEWSRLVAELVPGLVDPATGGALGDWPEQWSVLTDYRVKIAGDAGQLREAVELQKLQLAYRAEPIGALLAARPPDHAELTDEQQTAVHNFAVTLQTMGDLLRFERLPDCVEYYDRATDLFRWLGQQREEAMIAMRLGHAYAQLEPIRNPEVAERHYRRALTLTTAADPFHADVLSWLGMLRFERYEAALADEAPPEARVRHLLQAARENEQALRVAPADAIPVRARIHQRLGTIYAATDQLEPAFGHVQQALRHWVAVGDHSQAGMARWDLANLLRRHGRPADALAYARAALADLVLAGTRHDELERLRRLIDDLLPAADPRDA